MRSTCCPSRPKRGAPNPEQTLATLNTSGPRIDAKLPPRDLPDQQRDLRNDRIDTLHKIVYSQHPPAFFINGEQFTNSQNVMEKLELNKTSQWTIQNTTTFWHTFHIHINDFQITEENGVPIRQISSTTTSRSRPGRASPCATGRRISPASSSSTAMFSATRTTG